jgi:hypothetical protein
MGFRLQDLPTDLEKVELPQGVTCWCVPANTVVWEAARSYADQVMRHAVEGSEALEEVGIDVSMLPDLLDPHVNAGFRKLLFVQALAGTVIKRWEGVDYQETEGGPWLAAPATRAQINRLMMAHLMAEAFIDRYSRNYTARFSEGNASRPSPNGTSAAGRSTVPAAATSVSPVLPAAAARKGSTARMSKTRRRRRKGRASGA